MDKKDIKDSGNQSGTAKKNITRRRALKYMGFGLAGAAAGWYGLARTPLKSYIFGEKETQIDPDLMIQTRTDPVLGDQIPLLAYGCMRFPRLEDGSIDEEPSLEMIDYAYSHGVRYFDTAWGYIGGLSEPFMGRALKKYPRESFYLATKMPTPRIDSFEFIVDTFDKQLERCQVDYFDFYHLHTLSTVERYEKAYEHTGGYEYLRKQKELGRIKRLGFSFHGPREAFGPLCDYHDWDFVMIQANYYDWDKDGEYLYNELEKRNIPCLIMEPLRGGMLASLTAGAIRLLKREEPDKSAAWWAMQFIASKPNVLTVLSGMSVMEHVKENIVTFSDIRPMSPEREQVLFRALEEFRKVSPIKCTECDYCMPCPVGVDIPGVFRTYNKCVRESNVPDPDEKDQDFNKRRRGFLGTFSYALPKEQGAWRCIGCNQCVVECPQKIDIPAEMKKIDKLIEKLK